MHLSLQGGPSTPLSAAQREVFELGFEVTAIVRLEVLRLLDAGLSFGYLRLPVRPGGTVSGAGTALQAGVAARIRAPVDRHADSFRVIPYAELNASYLLDGALNRLGLAATVGVVPLSFGRLWVGPFVRALFIVPIDAQSSTQWREVTALLLTVGLAVDVWPWVGSKGGGA